jgi:two-component system CitB family sensor kinase
MKLIAQTSGVHQELSEALLDRLGDPVLGALLLAKAATASERGIELRVAEDLVLTTGTLDPESLITLLGNLIDNGLDAAGSATHDRWVAVSVSMQEGDLVLQVRDSGAGVAEGLGEQIFQEGFSTKTRADRRRGFGLALALQVARRNGGDITVANEGGAVFTARIPSRVAVPQ